MHALIVGADYIDPMKKALAQSGYGSVEHWTGRKVGDTRKEVPHHADLVVVLTEYVSHGLLRHVREEAARLGVPVLYCCYSVSDVRQKLSQHLSQHSRVAA